MNFNLQIPRFLSAITFIFILAATSLSWAADSDLEKVKSRLFDELLITKTPNFTAYKKVYIEEPSIEYSKGWLREFKSKTWENDRKATVERYRKVLKEQLVKAFGSQKIEIIKNIDSLETLSDDTLVVSANIEELYINAPELNRHTRQYVYSAGWAKVKIELKNKAGQTLAQIHDRQDTHTYHTSKPQLTSRILNQKDFKLLFKRWSNRLVDVVYPS